MAAAFWGAQCEYETLIDFFSSKQRCVPQALTNSAHDTGVMSEREKGNCTKELEVQFLSSNSSDETER